MDTKRDLDTARASISTNGKTAGSANSPSITLLVVDGPHDGLAFSGSTSGPGGSIIPPITIDALIKQGWTKDDLVFGFQIGLKPDGDVMGGAMAEVVTESLEHLSEADQIALATYLMEQ